MMLKLEEFCSGNSVQLAGKAELFLGREGAEWFPADVALSHTLHDTAFLPGNFIAGTDEHISALESPFVLANTPKHFTCCFWKLF